MSRGHDLKDLLDRDRSQRRGEGLDFGSSREGLDFESYAHGSERVLDVVAKLHDTSANLY
jgi:hypothetical protein